MQNGMSGDDIFSVMLGSQYGRRLMICSQFGDLDIWRELGTTSTTPTASHISGILVGI